MAGQPRQPVISGPPEWFTGQVYVEPLVRAAPPSRVNVSMVRFAPGARTAWHAHTVSQTLVVTDGVGRHQVRGEAMETLRAGDVVVTPAKVWHWHGATPDGFMAHLSITEAADDDRGDLVWGDPVSDQEYTGS